jgi:hypothetical protein
LHEPGAFLLKRGVYMQRVAILVDGGFFLKRYRSIYGKKTAEKVARDLYRLATNHAKGEHLYRVFYYDAHPIEKSFIIR